MKKSNFFYAVLAILSSVLSAAEEKISLEVLINKKQELKITRTEEEKLAWENLTDKTFSNLEVSQVHIDTVSPEHAITLIQEVQGIKSLELDHMQITPDLWNAIAKKAATLEKLDISWPKTLPKEIPPISEGLWQVTLHGNIDSVSIFADMKTFKQVISALPKTVTSLTIGCPFLFPLKKPLKTSVALFENFPNTIKQLTLHDYYDLTQEQKTKHFKAIANTCPGLREINSLKVNQLTISNSTETAEWQNLSPEGEHRFKPLPSKPIPEPNNNKSKIVIPSAYYWIAGAIGVPVACYLAYKLLAPAQVANPVLEQDLLPKTVIDPLIREKTASTETSLENYLSR